MTAARPYDIVLFGATGFTGALTAEYLAAHAGPGTRWALAGRNRAKLIAVRDRLAKLDAACADLPLLHADTTDAASIEDVAKSARVVITTVGPYVRHGEPLVAACARAGTDYVDLTGEPTFVDRMYVKYHREAVRSGARIVHACGFDSIPHDLGAYFTVKQLPEGVPLHLEGFLRARGDASGGTLHSAVGIFGDAAGMVRAERERRKVEEPPAGRRVRISRRPTPKARIGGGWTLPLPTIDPQIVVRSAASLDRYGPDFSYGHYAAVRRLATAAGMAAGSGALLALAALPPTRNLLLRLRAPGDGPSEEQRARNWFRVTFVGEGGGERVVTEVAGGDPGYGETAKMLAESALCLAHDDLPATSGQVTTAAAMGDALIDRLVKAGITFRVLDPA
ncbi:saccharopine dehydrogenase family protein [Actinomadura madurae]|uniref:saccharopine dehydrogenase family protein n=1 Tax=Actinomadura madurae TaxID=1993 RepID=UPI0020D21FC2|nr:saccharopine dehydrogenase NADP-binding domain-containing protein [Actinomadura madurae]MCP9949348.1 saccharopine dehydrogenase NADP-binding domain-containing protein [Actinomadura madurae]MCP9978591.1 saccharopine dehydrogenase NADP-binding domain-containing protein [Actinomadura madurae]MCQ0009883.1 saccharopine dehydrogenase NADP-binding domain-containing protein [Actinomadura madurae]